MTRHEFILLFLRFRRYNDDNVSCRVVWDTIWDGTGVDVGLGVGVGSQWFWLPSSSSPASFPFFALTNMVYRDKRLSVLFSGGSACLWLSVMRQVSTRKSRVLGVLGGGWYSDMWGGSYGLFRPRVQLPDAIDMRAQAHLPLGAWLGPGLTVHVGGQEAESVVFSFNLCIVVWGHF